MSGLVWSGLVWSGLVWSGDLSNIAVIPVLQTTEQPTKQLCDYSASPDLCWTIGLFGKSGDWQYMCCT
jgi:hypothetical protein